MALNANEYKAESQFDRPDNLDAGTYPGRLVWIISKGLQPQRKFKGEEKPPKHDVYTVYEMLDEFLKDPDGNDIAEKPRFISETFPMNPLSSDLAKSTKRYLALDPTQQHKGDWSKLVGAPCMITVVNNKTEDRIYDNIHSVQTMRPKEAANAPELVNEPKVFDIDAPDLEVFSSLPAWLQEDIKGNLEFAGSVLEKALGGEGGTKPAQEKKEPKPTDEPAGPDEGDGDW